jgi:hypothetical protein
MDKKVKQKYNTDFAVLTKLVNSFDPCGLIKGGAPSDEYDCLTQQILSSIYNKKSRQEIKQLITHEVDHHFEMPVEEKYKANFNDSIDKFLSTLEQTFNSTNAQH